MGAIPWTADALTRLERVPAGYMRDMTRDLILRHADETRASEITLAVAEGGIALAKREMVAMISAQRKASRAATTGAQAACPVASPTHGAAVHGDACPVADIPSTAEASSGSPPHAREGVGERSALNEVKPAFIARLARYYAPGSVEAAGRQVPPALDFVWDAAAERALDEVPAYCRELARWRVEWTAYTQHLGRLITLAVWQRDHPDWDDLARHLVPARMTDLAWEPEARAKLEAVPAFIRAQVALALEINLAHLGGTCVTLAGYERVAARWVADPTPQPPPLRGEGEPEAEAPLPRTGEGLGWGHSND